MYARSSAGNTFSYVLSDHQGSNSDLTNSSGTSIVNESFTPFGRAPESAPPGPVRPVTRT